jgi:hypothetical protein
MSPKKGQYADGHERPDVVDYRQNKFLPAWAKIQERMETWTKDNVPEIRAQVAGKTIVVWFHDESIFMLMIAVEKHGTTKTHPQSRTRKATVHL